MSEPTKQHPERALPVRSRQGTRRKRATPTPPEPPLPPPDDREGWRSYWQGQGQPWRREPVIDKQRQQFLAQCRAISPDIKQGIYPFKDIKPKVTRADIEWLLDTHESGGKKGFVDWNKEEDWERDGLDLRGADLSHANLSNLPLTSLRGGLTLREWIGATEDQREMAAIHLEETALGLVHLEAAHLWGAHLERADLRYASLVRADLTEAHLERAYLDDAVLEGARLYGAHLKDAHLHRAHLEGASLGRTPPEGKLPIAEGTLLGPLVGPYLIEVKAVPAGAGLENAHLCEAHLEGASLWDAHLKGARLLKTHLEGARLRETCLKETFLCGAFLAGADLTEAHLEGADLREAHLEGKTVPPDELRQIQQGKPDFPEHLQAADLGYAQFDSSTILHGISLGNGEHGYVRLVDVNWGGVNLSGVDWRPVKALGDEDKARQLKNDDGSKKQKEVQQADYQAAVRANRQLAVALRNQGMNEVADRFTYRAQVLQRELLWLETGLPMPGFKHQMKTVTIPQLWQQRKHLSLRPVATHAGQWIHQQGQQSWHWLRSLRPATWPGQLWQRPAWELALALLILLLALGASVAHWWWLLFTLLGIALGMRYLWLPRGRKLLAYLFSLFLAVLTGYGFRMWRILVAYATLITSFALGYWDLDLRTSHPLSFWQAVILSVTAFHGRVFSNPFNLSDPQIVLTALEAIVGLVIEGVFIAMLTQRFFNR